MAKIRKQRRCPSTDEETRRGVLCMQRGAKVGFQLEYMKHEVYPCIIINYWITFHTNNCKPTFAPSCIYHNGNITQPREK